MPQHQLVGIAVMIIAVVDTAVGHLLIAPRVAEEKRAMLKVVFSSSGVAIAALGWAIYKGIIAV